MNTTKRSAARLSLMRMCVQGYWYCHHCERATQLAHEVWTSCALCGSAEVVWRPPVFFEPVAACPLCRPELWDGGLDAVPMVAACREHQNSPLVGLFRKYQCHENYDIRRVVESLAVSLGIITSRPRRRQSSRAPAGALAGN